MLLSLCLHGQVSSAVGDLSASATTALPTARLQGAHPSLRIALHHCADTNEAVAGAVNNAERVVLLLLHALVLHDAPLVASTAGVG